MARTRVDAVPLSPLVTREEVCRTLSISRSTSYRLVHEGFLPAPLRVGPGIVRWQRSDLEALLARLAADRGVAR